MCGVRSRPSRQRGLVSVLSIIQVLSYCDDVVANQVVHTIFYKSSALKFVSLLAYSRNSIGNETCFDDKY